MKNVSVVIPFLNERNTLKAKVKNILDIEHFLVDQKVPVNVEWIFVDGGSEDGSVEYLKKLDFHVIFAKKGRASQMNAGAQIANGDWVIFLHADTVLPIHYFVEFAHIPDNFFWGFNKLKLKSDKKIFRIIEKSIHIRSKLMRYVTGDQTLFIKTSFFHSGYCYADIALMEDVEISRRLYKQSLPYIASGFVVSSARKWLKQGVLKTIVKMWCIQTAYRFNVCTQKLNNWYYTQELSNNVNINVLDINTKPLSIMVAQFAKAPIINLVKTRLSSAISPEDRLVLHKEMVKHVLINTLYPLPDMSFSNEQGERNCYFFHQLWVTQSHPFFDQISEKNSTALREQKGINLGDRLTDCVKRNLHVTDAVILMGSDCLDINQDTLTQVATYLKTHEVVVIPATDGGFVLLALTCWRNDLFENIEWGADSVYQQLRENIERNRLTFKVLPAMYDIDRPEDLSRLPESVRACLS